MRLLLCLIFTLMVDQILIQLNIELNMNNLHKKKHLNSTLNKIIREKVDTEFNTTKLEARFDMKQDNLRNNSETLDAKDRMLESYIALSHVDLL